MKNQTEHIENHLMIRYLNHDCSEQEILRLELWLQEDAENQKQFDKVKNIWMHSESIQDFSNIDVQNDWIKTRARLPFSQTQQNLSAISLSSRISKFSKIAAVFIILIGIGFILNEYIFQPVKQLEINTGTELSQINLPDGSVVHLNKHSHLMYPEKFKGNERIVKFTGEAYFEIASNPEKAFKIITEENAVIEILGTAFNIQTSKINKEVKVNVTHGTVALYGYDHPNQKVILRKDEAGLFSNDKAMIVANDNLNFLSWKTGILRFKDKPLNEAISELQKFYNIQISFQNISIEKLKLTATFDNQSWKEVVEELSMIFGLSYTDENGKILLFVSN